MMRRFVFALITAALLGACAATPAATTPAGPETTVGSVTVSAPWARPAETMAGMTSSAAYMTIRSGDGDRLMAVSTAAAQYVELHTMTDDNGVMRMREVEGGIEVPADSEVDLKPGGFHVMLLGLTRELKEGDTITLDLTFETAGKVTVDATVRKP